MVEILVPAYNLEKLDRVMLATEKKKSPVLKAVKDPRISNGSTAVPSLSTPAACHSRQN
jgi:hypothetical protein